MKSNLSIFPFMDHDFAVNNKLCLKFFPKLPFPRNFSCSLSFIVFHFTFKLIHFELIFVRCDSPQGSLYCSGCQIAPSLLAEIGIFPLLNCFCTVKKKSVEKIFVDLFRGSIFCSFNLCLSSNTTIYWIQ